MRDLGGSRAETLRRLPQVQKLLELWSAQEGAGAPPLPAMVRALRTVLDQVRAELLAHDGVAEPPAATLIVSRAAAALQAAARPALRRVINATGIVLHTNLGRAPLSEAAAAAVTDAARGYINLEYDLHAGARGSRTQGIEPLLTTLTGAEAALAVNNNAAAVLLALSALADGGEVIVSRGELVEIGGGFRIPDVIRQGGARLVEVGTTNRTRLADYRDAITPGTRVLLKVHPSNYRVVGFTEQVGIAALSGLAQERGLLVVDDQGSGLLSGAGQQGKVAVRDSLAFGADLVMFSGDKLLGGPQAGLLVGRMAAIEPLRRHPLLRAVRLDKLSLVALEATLRLHRDGATDQLPVQRMLAQAADQLQRRAERLSGLLGPGHAAGVEPSTGYAGGGSLPGAEIASWAVALSASSVAADELARRLRTHRPAIVGRVSGGRMLLDMLAVGDDELPAIAAAVGEAMIGTGGA